MVMQLLPASAKAFAERSGPNVVLGPRPEPWLTATLKRVNKAKRPLNNVSQHQRCLEDILAGKEAIWSLASIIVPRYPAKDMVVDEDQLIDCKNYQMLHIEGYVVHVDMVLEHEVAFKLTQDAIDALSEYHKDVWSIDAAAEYSYDWPEKHRHVQKLQDEFVQAINGYVFRAGQRALEGLEEEGTGELLEHRSVQVKAAVDNLFKPLLPPPPKVTDLIGPPMGWWQSQYVMGSYYAAQYSQPYTPQYAPQYQQQQYLPRPVESWRVLGSTPSPSPSYQAELPQATWSQAAQPLYTESHLPSPTPSYTQPPSYSSSSPFESQLAFMPSTPLLPLPSSLFSQQHCSTSASSAYGSYYGYNDMPLTPIGAF